MKQFNVVFGGAVTGGRKVEEVKKNLAALFKADEKKIGFERKDTSKLSTKLGSVAASAVCNSASDEGPTSASNLNVASNANEVEFIGYGPGQIQDSRISGRYSSRRPLNH